MKTYHLNKRGPGRPPSDPVGKLLTDALEESKKKGHSATISAKEDSWGEILCGICLKSTGVAMVPPPGAEQISGSLVESRCGE